MITLVGVGHVFAISNNVKDLIRQRRPDLVCLELDPPRYQALMSKGRSGQVPPQYALLAFIQKRMAGKFETEVGEEMVAAAKAAGEVGAKIALIDMNAASIFAGMWKRMSLKEKFGLIFGALVGLVSSKEAVEREVQNYTANAETYLEKVGEEFPTIKHVLIDDRNRHMSSRLASLAGTYGNIVAIVGDGHVPGMLEELKAQQVEAIRLRDLMTGAFRKDVPGEYTYTYYYQ